MRIALLTLLALFIAATGRAEIKGADHLYKLGDVEMEGYIAYDDAVKGPRPAVLIVHEWTGLGDYGKRRAREIAALGYVAFAVDIYGKGVRATDPKQAGELAGKYKGDRPLLRARIQAALDDLLKRDDVDPARIAAIGYCFGGTTALELARSGAPIAGVVSFHGGLSTPMPAKVGDIKAKILVLHGADDPFVPAAEVAGFEKEMFESKTEFEFVKYPGAVHSFTNPDAGSDNSKGAAYNADADKKSFEAMKAFFAKIFAEKKTAAK